MGRGKLFGKRIINKLRKERRKYTGQYVALDNKDRIIAFGKKESKVFAEAENFGWWDREYGFKVFKIYDEFTKNTIRGLID